MMKTQSLLQDIVATQVKEDANQRSSLQIKRSFLLLLQPFRNHLLLRRAIQSAKIEHGHRNPRMPVNQLQGFTKSIQSNRSAQNRMFLRHGVQYCLERLEVPIRNSKVMTEDVVICPLPRCELVMEYHAHLQQRQAIGIFYVLRQQGTIHLRKKKTRRLATLACTVRNRSNDTGQTGDGLMLEDFLKRA